MGSDLLIIAILLVSSAFASSSETALFSLNRFQLRRIRERYRASYQRIRTLLAHPSRLLIVIILINELVNLTFTSIVTEHVQRFRYGDHVAEHSSEQWLSVTLITMAITLPTLLLICEITPKIIAARMNKYVSIFNAPALIFLYRILFPLLWTLDSAIGYTLRKFKAEGRDHLSKTMSVLSEEDFMLLMEEGHKEGTVDPSERKLIKNVFEFDDSTVTEVMTPIQQAFSISANAKISEIMPDLRVQKYSRVPVYQKTRRNLVGVLYLKDLIPLRSHTELKDIDVKSLMARPMFVSPNTRLSVLFRRFKEAKMHMAVVGDDQEALGVVTMEDVLESIFGEIDDERDV